MNEYARSLLVMGGMIWLELLVVVWNVWQLCHPADHPTWVLVSDCVTAVLCALLAGRLSYQFVARVREARADRSRWEQFKTRRRVE